MNMTPEERREILGLVTAGKINVDEAARLLQGEPAAAAAPPPRRPYRPKSGFA
jgi:hypothetical protein